MMRLVVVFFIIFFANQSIALTFKSGQSISSNNGQNEAKAPKLVIDIVNRVLKPSELTDEQLCESLKYFDSVPTYYEMKSRGLDCLHISKTPKNWSFISRDESFKYLRAYKQKYDVIIPKFSLKVIKDDTSLSDYLKTLKALNPSFSDDVRKSLNKHAVSDDYSEHFCLDWFPQIAYVANDQSKGLDGTVSWKEDTLRDAFLTCQAGFSRLVYLALEDARVRSKIQKAIENWIDNDTPHREQDGQASFLYPYFINRILVAIDMLHSDFNWSEQRYEQASDWMKRRVYEIFPGDAPKNYKRLTLKCELNKNLIEERNSEVCQNGGIIQAQAMLRAGMFAKDREMVELSFVAFHRYMSGIRVDGSNAADSRRGCTAADYNMWASEFLSDYIYIWSQISSPLWEHKSFERGTPASAVEYSLSLFDNWEKINEHTIEERWEGCGEDKKNRTQEAGTKYEGQYSKLAFSPYLEKFKSKSFVAELASYNRYYYTSGSGQAFDINIVLNKPSILEEVEALRSKLKIEKVSIFGNSYRKIRNLAEIKLPSLGLVIAPDTRISPIEDAHIDLGRYFLEETVNPKSKNKSTKYRFRFRLVTSEDREKDKKIILLSNKRVTIFERDKKAGRSRAIGLDLFDTFERHPETEIEWQRVWDICPFEDANFDWLEVPIVHNDWLQPLMTCLDKNLENEHLQLLIQSLAKIGNEIDVGSL